MPAALRLAPLALIALPFGSQAQVAPTGMVGLEVPAPAPAAKGHFLTGAYVAGNYSPLPTGAGYGYGVQPYLRYQLGSSAKRRPRPFLQYTFAPYRWQAYGAGTFAGSDGTVLPANPGFAPLAARVGQPYGTMPYGGLGAFSVGIPMRIGHSSAALNLGGSVIEGLLWGLVR